MALTLAEAEKLSNDVLLKGVIETILTESDILKKLPFIDIVGNGLTYDQESTLPTAQFYSPGDTWVESTPTFTQQTATLAILGGDADVDEFLKKTRSNVQDIKAVVVQEKSKSVSRKFDDSFIYSDKTADAKAFNGCHKLVSATTAMQVHAGSSTTEGVGTMAKLRALCDLVMPGGPDYLIMNRSLRNYLTAYAERSSSPIRFEKADFGKRMMFFDGVPILITDWILNTEAIASGIYNAKTGGASTTIFAAKFGERQLSGCQSGGIEVKDLGDLETKDANRVRIKWYVSMALFNTLSLARYDGIDADGTWTA